MQSTNIQLPFTNKVLIPVAGVWGTLFSLTLRLRQPHCINGFLQSPAKCRGQVGEGAACKVSWWAPKIFVGSKESKLPMNTGENPWIQTITPCSSGSCARNIVKYQKVSSPFITEGRCKLIGTLKLFRGQASSFSECWFQPQRSFNGTSQSCHMALKMPSHFRKKNTFFVTTNPVISDKVIPSS